MKKLFFIFSFFTLASFTLFADDVWKSVEEVEINGSVATKNIYVSDNLMKTENVSDAIDSETVIDLQADKIILINHKNQTFQNVKLSEYVKFAQQLAADLLAKGSVDPSKIVPQVTFEKVGEERVGSWDCEVWSVFVDGRAYSTVWVAPELKDSPILSFKKRFAAILPRTIAKYRAVEKKIEDNFLERGMVVKSLRTQKSNKIPPVTTTIKTITRAKAVDLSTRIPQNYVDKSAR